MKILLTGGDGFTGRHFAAAAAGAGHEVVAVTADLRDADALAREVAAARPDIAVHLAGISFVAHADEKAFYDVNLFGSLNLLQALQACGTVRRVLLASSANVYGNSEKSPVDESEPVAPVNHYAASKAAMEFMARARAGDLPLVIARPFNYTGIGQSPDFVIPKLVEGFRARSPKVLLGNLDVEREYNDVRFVCEAYLRLLEERVAPGTYNVCTGRTYALRSVLQMLQDLTGHRIEVEVSPHLVRANEIRRLCGSPALLERTIGPLPPCVLRDTVSWMLQASA